MGKGMKAGKKPKNRNGGGAKDMQKQLKQLQAMQAEMEQKQAELEKKAPSLIISRRPCALLKTVKHSAPVKINADKCIGCKACLNVGCPALSQTKRENGKYLATIDNTQCVGCGVCASACKFSAIEKGGND